MLLALGASAASANWERRPVYVDDGMRFTLSLRGGFAYGFGSVHNELGAMIPESFWFDASSGLLVGESFCGGPVGCANAGFTHIGEVNIGNLPASKDFSAFTWTGSVAIGFTVPKAAQWRIEGNWDHIAESHYRAAPMFSGSLPTTGGYIIDGLQSGGVHSTLNSDILTAMVYYDWFDGCVKPVKTFVPYVGLGIGYAMSRTVLELTDLYGDLSDQWSMQPFGEPTNIALEFYTSKNTSRNFAAAGALGFSYGITDGVFLDAGVRVTYIPRITYSLNNALSPDVAIIGTKHKEVFSIRDVIYTSALVGVRFEF